MPQNDDIPQLIRKANRLNTQFRHDSAIVCLTKAYSLAKKNNDQLSIANINRLKGYTFLKEHQYDSAHNYLDKALKQAKSTGNDTILANAELNLGWVLQQTGRNDSSLYYYRDALNTYRSIADTAGMAGAYNYLAVYYKFSGDYDKGLENALHANYIYRKSDNLERYVNSLIQLGNIYEKLNDNDTALACYENAYRLSIENDLARYIVSSSVNIAVIHYKRGKKLKENNELLKAEEEFNLTKTYYQKAIDFDEKIQNKSMLTLLYSNFSLLYRRMGDDSAAMESAKKAIRIAEEINDVGARLRALNNLGICYKKLEDYPKAEACYLEGLALAKKLNHLEELGKITNNLANIYELQGDYRKALEYSRQETAFKDSLFNEKKQKLVEKHKTDYEILHLKDLNRMKELDKQRIRAERNVMIWISVFVVVTLMGLLLFFRMRARKNRIIAEHRIQKLEDEKKLMAAQAVLVGQEKERERIAQELHDGIGVLLSTASIHFSSVESKTDKETGEMLKKANKLLKEASKEVRQISHNMMPGVLSKFGLKEAVEDLFEEVEEAGIIEVEQEIVYGDERLHENMEIMIYRIIQEMLNNTLKYAKATKISFYMTRSSEEIKINFADDGIGFDEDKLPHGKNLGISGIRSRVEYLGGTIELKSEPGSGTRYSITIPVRQKAG
ncbi:MAG: tetratricopeptide repeat protein [Chlorobi bacterium]|nr:tetratricopeptide repeat protein [Chlorobiota bacterium]